MAIKPVQVTELSEAEIERRNKLRERAKQYHFLEGNEAARKKKGSVQKNTEIANALLASEEIPLIVLMTDIAYAEDTPWDVRVKMINKLADIQYAKAATDIKVDSNAKIDIEGNIAAAGDMFAQILARGKPSEEDDDEEAEETE